MAVEFRTVFSVMLAFLLTAAAAPPLSPTGAPHMLRVADDKLCTDDMEVEPGYDGYDTMPVAEREDGGCALPADLISA
jgi:hypothetical protein